jgi:hypothetical protein
MRAFAKIAIAVAFVSAIVWFGHHHTHPLTYGYAALQDAGRHL